MTSKAEAVVSRGLRAILEGLVAGFSIEDSAEFRDVQTGLEFWIPEVLDWRYESLDAFLFASARKIGPNEAAFVGLGLLISDQAWTPLYLRIVVSPTIDAVSSFDCRLGEVGTGLGGIVRVPYGSKQETVLLLSLPERLHSIQWMFRVSTGSTAREVRTPESA